MPSLGEEMDWDDYASKFPRTVAVARRLMDDLTTYVDSRHLDWKPFLRKHWLGYVRPGGRYDGYFVAAIALDDEKAEFAVKLPVSPEVFAAHGPGLNNPYPNLTGCWWDAEHSQWTWPVRKLSEVPEVSKAVDISRQYQP